MGAGACARALVILAVAASPAFGQVRDRPVADPAAGPRLSSASISGRVEVISGDQRAPVRRARLLLRSESDHIEIIKFTELDGRYRFEHLASGAYSLRVDKPGFVPARVDGTPLPWERKVEVKPDQAVTLDFLTERGAAIEGRVVDQFGQPLVKATVTAGRVVQKDARTLLFDDEASATTDDLGRYRIHTVPPGEYAISATLGQRREPVFAPGTPELSHAGRVTAKSGAAIGPIDLTLTVPAPPQPSAAIDSAAAKSGERLGNAGLTGVVLQAGGGPVPFASVGYLQMTQNGGRGLTIRADEQGRFELNGLASGDYLLFTFANGVANREVTAQALRVTLQDGQSTHVSLRLAAMAAIEGRVVDEFGDPVPGIDVKLLVAGVMFGRRQLLARDESNSLLPTDDLGRFRFYGLSAGNYWLEAVGLPFNQRSNGLVADAIVAGGYAPTFFPGTDRPSDAKPVTLVGGGKSVTGIVLPLSPPQTGTLRGLIVDSDGNRASSTTLKVARRNGADYDLAAAVSTSAARDGSFEIEGLPAGEYMVHAMQYEPQAFGTVPVTLLAGVVTSLVPIVVTAPKTVRARVTFDTDQSRPPTSGIQLSVLAMDPAGAFFSASARTPSTVVDGRVDIPSVSYAGVIRLPASVKGWALKSVTLEKRDITNESFAFGTTDVDEVEVTLTDRVGSISGSVLDDACANRLCGVAVFVDDERRWTIPNRNVITAPVDRDGRFSVDDLLPGKYFVLAMPVSPLAAGEFGTPEWLAAHRGAATPVVVTEGQRTVISLPVR